MSPLRSVSVGAAAAALLWPVLAAANWPPDGVVITTTDARNLLIASDTEEGAFIQWLDSRNPPLGTNDDLFMQRVTGSGLFSSGWPVNGEPTCADPHEQYTTWPDPALGPDGLGGALLVWTDFRNADPDGTTGPDIYAQRVLADGSIAPGWPVNGAPVCRAPGYQTNAVVLADGLGGAFCTWEDDETGDIFLQHLVSNGEPAPGWPADGLAICTDPSNQGGPAICPDGSGGVIDVWGDLRDGPLALYGQRVTAAGQVLWAENGVRVAANRARRDLVPDGGGGAYVACSTPGSFYDGGYYLVRITSAGTGAPGWPSGGAPVCLAADDRVGLRMVGEGTDGVFLVWSDYRDFYDDDIFALRVLSDGTRSPGWPMDGLRVTDNTGLDDFVDIAPDGAGGAFLTWTQYFNETGDRVVVHHLTATGAVAAGWPPGGSQIQDVVEIRGQRITSDGAGGAIVAWERLGPPNEGRIRAMRFATDGPVPVLVSLVSTDVEPDLVRLTWYVPDGSSFAAMVERRTETGEWLPLGTIRPDGSGKLSYEDRSVSPGTRYGYRLSYPDEASTAYTAETWVSVPAVRLALRGFTPNPSMGDPVVAFSLTSGEPAALELYDVTGRLALTREVGSLGPGAHTMRLESRDRLPAGVYTVRVRQGPHSASARAVVVR